MKKIELQNYLVNQKEAIITDLPDYIKRIDSDSF